MRKTLIVLAVILVQGVSGRLFAQGDFGFEIGAFGGRSIRTRPPAGLPF